MKFLKKFESKKLPISSQEVIKILKEFEYILVDEGCSVEYMFLNKIANTLVEDIQLNIYTPKYMVYKGLRNNPKFRNKNVQKLKQEEYFQEYIDRIFDEIPKIDFNILIMVDGLNLVYNIGYGKLLDGESLLAKKGKIELKSKK